MALFWDTTYFLIGHFSGGMLLTFLIIFTVFVIASRKPRGIPPSPSWTLPFVGDLPLLITGDILKTFRKLRSRHGDIFSFYMGRKLTIVINSYKLIYGAGVTKGAIFSGRPQNFFSYASIKGGRGIIMSEGPFWHRQRRFIHERLNKLGFGKSSFESKILKEVTSFIDVLRNTNGQPFDVKETIHASMANIIFSLVCGRRHDYKDPVFQKILKSMDDNLTIFLQVSMLNTCFPFLKYLPFDPFNMKVNQNQNDIFQAYTIKLYNEHMQKMNLDKDRSSDDLMDAYIDQTEQSQHGENQSDFSFDQLHAVMTELLAAGAETSATVFRWAILYLINNPDIKQRLQSDIDNVVGSHNQPCLADRQKLPFVEAFIMEVLRKANVAPFGMPRAILGDSDVIFEGYRIPKDSVVFFNYETALLDPEAFQEPESFKPERFLDKSGHLLKPNELIPFGIGRRVCLGEQVAKMELFLFLTTMIREFNLLPEDEDRLPTLKAELGITNAPMDYKFRALKRCSM